MIPTFWKQIEDPAIKTVLLVGCGGGFDFVHSVMLIPDLVKMGKTVVMGSYSFGNHDELVGDSSEIAFTREEVEGVAFNSDTNAIDDVPNVLARKVDASCSGPQYYAPEIHVCEFLDRQYPEKAPHSIYAYYARFFTVPLLRAFYTKLVRLHQVDAIVLIDGGSDSLMRGDEHGLGDPIEDAVSVAAVAQLAAPAAPVRVLLSVGLGADRFNGVSDAASLRAVAELTAQGGFLGAVALEPGSDAFRCYRACVEHIYGRQHFRSVLTGSILAAAAGAFGDEVPPELRQTGRVAPGDAYLWPLMAVLWAFDPRAVARRSLIIPWIQHCTTVSAMLDALRAGRAALADGVRPAEELPRFADMCPHFSPDFLPLPAAAAAAAAAAAVAEPPADSKLKEERSMLAPLLGSLRRALGRSTPPPPPP